MCHFLGFVAVPWNKVHLVACVGLGLAPILGQSAFSFFCSCAVTIFLALVRSKW